MVSEGRGCPRGGATGTSGSVQDEARLKAGAHPERKVGRGDLADGRGFSAFFPLAILVLLGVLLSTALPPFVKTRDKAMEAQSKANLRVIQVALERYAVDAGEAYPWVLSGGDPFYNTFRMMGAIHPSKNLGPVENAFLDNVENATGLRQAPDGRVDPGYCPGIQPLADDPYPDLPVCMDALLLGGYLAAYPPNPFFKAAKASCYGAFSTCLRGSSFGGEMGNRMFDTSMGRGDWPWLRYFQEGKGRGQQDPAPWFWRLLPAWADPSETCRRV